MKILRYFSSGFIIIFLLGYHQILAQTTITLQPDSAAGKDALISSYSASLNTNYGNDPEFNAGSWTISSVPFNIRSLVQFNLSGIPANAFVVSAFLSLYFNPNNASFTNVHSGINDSYLQRVIAPWQENTVTWNNQPATTAFNQVSIPGSTSATQDFTNISVTNLVTDILVNPATNYGFLFRLQTEAQYRALIFASSDYGTAAKRPKLEVTYSLCPINVSISAYGPLSHCFGETDTLFAPANGLYTYQWKRDGNSIAGATSAFYIASSSGSHIYNCDITANGCTVASNQITVQFTFGNSLPGITITTPQNQTKICATSLPISAPLGYSSYKWYKDNLLIAQTTSNSYNATLSGTYYCTAYQGCDYAVSNFITLTATGIITASASSIPCGGGVVTLNSDNITGAYKQWYFYGSPIHGAISNYLQTSDPGQFYLITTTPSCGSVTSNTVYIDGPSRIASPLPLQFCFGGVDLYATPFASSYQWKQNGVDIPGANFSVYNAASSGNYSCSITTATCGSAISNALQVQDNTPPPSPYLITEPPGIPDYPLNSCDPNVTIAAYPPGLSYNWVINGIIFSNAQQYIHPSIAGNHFCEVDYGCGISSTYFNLEHVLPATSIPLNPIAQATQCDNSAIACILDFYWNSYQWRKNGINIPGATTFIFGASSTGYYSCLVSNGCLSQVSDSVLLTFVPSPLAKINPLTNTTFCNGGSVTLNAGASTGSTFNWYLNGGLVGTGTSYVASASGNYQLQASNAYCAVSDTQAVNEVLVPPAVINSSSGLSFCSGDSLKLEVGTGAGFTYQWKLNGANITGGFKSRYYAKFSGSYTVKVIASCGFTVSAPVIVTMNSKPAPVATASGPLVFCNGDSVILSTAFTSGASYQWKKYGTDISGAIGTAYTAKSTGTYKVVKTNSLGCTGTSAGVTVTVNSKPTPVITPQGPTTFCAGDSVILKSNTSLTYSYQWKKNNANINGAVNSKYTAKTAGSYKVKITNSSGCTNLSAQVNVSVPCREEGIEHGITTVHVFPNPGAGPFTVSIDNKPENVLSVISIFDIAGRMIQSNSFDENKFQTGFDLAPGVYEFVVVIGSEKWIHKVVKMD